MSLIEDHFIAGGFPVIHPALRNQKFSTLMRCAVQTLGIKEIKFEAWVKKSTLYNYLKNKSSLWMWVQFKDTLRTLR